MNSSTGSPHAILPLLIVIALTTALPYGHAQPTAESLPPIAALDWIDPELAAARAAVWRLEAESSPWGRIDYAARIDPVLRYRDYPGDGRQGEWAGRIGFSATVDFDDPPDTRARTLQRLERARREVALLSLDGVSAALLAHADLLIAQERDRSAREALAEAEADLAAAEGDARRSRTLELELRLAELDHTMALQDLRAARLEATGFGLGRTAHYEPLRFEFPDPAQDPRDTVGYRLLELELLEAEAELALARQSPLDDLRLRTGYRTRAAGFDAEGGLVNGSPRATLGVDLPGGAPRWEIEVSAQLVLDDGWRELSQLEEAVSIARGDLETFVDGFRTELANARTSAELAEEAVELAEQEVELTGTRSAQGRLYRAWVSYLRAVADLLELAGAGWQVRNR